SLHHVLEFIHHIGLNNVSVRQRGYHSWGFTKLKRVYNALLIQITNKMILSKRDVMEVLRINDKYLHFDECLFEYIDGTIASTFDTYDEHEVAYLCRHLNKILFFFALQSHGIKYDLNVHRLVKRYVCKSLVFSPELGQQRLEGQLGVSSPHGDDAVPGCSEAPRRLLLHTFKERIRKSSLVKTLNKELSKSAHEYKYYNLVELLEFYSLFEIKKKEMIKRLINEVDKYINIMRYAYHAKALILFSLNRKQLDEENKKSIRRLIRRTSQMLHFYWPVEFILETIIACASFMDNSNKTIRNLFLYLKGNIKKCVHPVLLVNLLKSLASTQISEWTVCNQILNYVKEKKDTIHEVYVVQILKYLSVLKYPNDELFVSFLISDGEGGLSRVQESHVVTLFQFFSEHLINCPSLGESLTRETYAYLHQVAKNTIMKLPEEYLIHCAFSVLTYYFVDIILNKNRKNVDLLEKMMFIFGHKIRAGLNILTEENEEKKASFELLHVISAVLKMIYEKMERRLPDELFTLCTHVEKHLTAVGGETGRGGRGQKMESGEAQMGEQRTGQTGEQRDDPTTTREYRTEEAVYQNENVRTCLKPYEAIREWFLNNHNYDVSYVSVADWESKYM
ncbi:hypothetical protein PCYB_061920, partial [Plasmodium cynomolgi strain B]